MVKNLPANAGESGLIPGPGMSSEEENGNPLQYSCLENSMDRGAWQAKVHGVIKSWKGHTHTNISTLNNPLGHLGTLASVLSIIPFKKALL